MWSVGDSTVGVEVQEDSGPEENLYVEALTVEATYDRVSRLGVVLHMSCYRSLVWRGGVSRRVCLCLSFMRAETMASKNTGLTCHGLFYQSHRRATHSSHVLCPPQKCKPTYTIYANPVVSNLSLCSKDEDGMFVDCVSVGPKASMKPFFPGWAVAGRSGRQDGTGGQVRVERGV